MALTDEGNGGIPATMLVGPTGYAGGMPYPVYQNGGGNSGGWDQGNGWWIILLFILLASGNWGNQNGYGGGFGGGQPIIVNDGNNGSVQRGFDQAAVMGGINGVQSGINSLATQLCGCCGDIQNSLCNGFAGVNNNVSNGFAQAEIANNARQMANMNQAFAAQTAQAQGFNAVQAQLAQCCCDNRLATTQLQAVVQQENCADRAAVADGIRDIIVNNTANTQRILDQICQDKIDAKNDTIAQLRQELLYARGQASQDVQTAAIRAGQATTANQLIQEMRSCPVPSMPVYGMTPIFNCPQNNGCGCGCGCNA